MGPRKAGPGFQNLLVMGNRLVAPSAAGQDEAEVVVGLRVIGFGFKPCRYWRMASSIAPRPAKALARLKRASTRSGLIFSASRYSAMASSGPAPLFQSEAQVVVGLRVVGIDFQGLLVMGNGLVNPAPLF